MKLRYILPLTLFIFITFVLWRGLQLHPNVIPSPLINKVAPNFELPRLTDVHKKTTNKDLLGHITLFNVWATWCYACAMEHNYLVELAKTKGIYIFGLDYKDDTVAANNWIHEKGNPYYIIASDATGDTAINWGVYGTPETFLIDQHGIIRYKLIGPITPEIWEKDLEPMIETLQGEP